MLPNKEKAAALSAAQFDALYRSRLQKLATSNLSDALDKLGLNGAVIGIVPQWGKTMMAANSKWGRTSQLT